VAIPALVLLVLPIAHAAPGPGTGLTPSSPIHLPAALTAPWSARSGYVSFASHDASSVGPAVGVRTVVVSLWAKNLNLYGPPGAAARGLTLAQFQAQYSPSPSDYSALEAYLVGHGLRIEKTWPDRMSLTASGPADEVGAAFGTALESGRWQGHTVTFPASVPVLPAPFSSEALAVSGLSSGFSAFSLPFHALPLPSPRGGDLAPPLTPALGTTNFVTPSAVHAAYDLNPLYNLSGSFHPATNSTIALILWGDGYDPSDIQTFFSQYYPSQFPAPTVTAYPVDGAPAPSASATKDPSQAPQELTLDIEWSGSAAPGASIDAVYAPDGPSSNSYSPSDTSMEDALSTALNTIPGVQVISMSFGLPEGTDTTFEAAYTNYFSEAQARNITVLAASGDDGGSKLSSGQCTTTPEVQFPASSPLALAVGGTDPILSQSSIGGPVTGIASETGWNRSGGGYSGSYPSPSWQQIGSAAAVIGTNGRGIPDVAGPAAFNFFYYSGTQMAGEGTSFATPMWAGILAEINAIRGTPLGFVTPRLYAVGAGTAAGSSAPGLSDITSGSSCLWSAKPGYDLVTGWGSPRGLYLYAALTSTFVSLSVSASPTRIAPGGTTSVVVTVRNATSHAGIPNIPVNLTLAATGYTGPCGGVFSRATPVTDGNGTARATLSVPYCYPGGSAEVGAQVLSGGYFGTGSVAVSINLLSFTGPIALFETYPYNVILFVIIVVIAIGIGLALSRRGRSGRIGPPPPPGVPPGAWATSPPPPWTQRPGPPPPAPPPYGPPPPGGAARASGPVVTTVRVPVGSPQPPPAPGRSANPPPPPSSRPSPGSPAIPSAPAASRATSGTVPSTGAIRCSRCGGLVPAYAYFCPACGAPRR
jgi:kumamolisin